MFKQKKIQTFTFQVEPYTIKWYPSDRICMDSETHKMRPKKVPPLMVRKAEWRR